MHEIQRALTTAARRLYLNAFLRALVVMSTAAAAVLLALVAAEKLGPIAFDWRPIVVAAAGITLLTAAIAAWARRPRGVALADELDRRAGLRETLSTAIALEGDDTPWAVAVKETATERARRIVMRDAVPVTAPRRWQTPLALALAAGGVFWLAPRYDLSGVLDRQAAEEQQQAEVRTTALEIETRENELKEILDRAGVEFDDEESGFEDADAETPKTAEELNRAALKKLTKLSDTLDEKMKGDQAQQAKALQENIQRLKTPGPGPMVEFARSMARGQFKDAQKALEDLNKSIQDGAMSDEDKLKAAEQLRSLSEQMEKLAKQNEALKQQLEKQGMDAEQAERLASDPDALKEALEQMQGMSDQQKQDLLNQAMGQMQANQSMQSMANAMSELADQMQAACENPGQGGQNANAQQSGGQNASNQAMQNAMQQMSDQLSACEMASAEMQSLQAAMGECQSQMSGYGESLCENPNGSGRGGQRAGEADVANDLDQPLAARDDYMLKSEKTSVANNGGPIIGSTMVYGAQVKGEATAQFGEAVGASAVQAAEAIESMRVPREYHDAVRHYFGRLEKAAEESGAAPEAGDD
jgi:hypothetical protein